MTFATNTNIGKNIVRTDVIDAMIRQPFSNKTIPFKNHEIKNKVIIKAVDYDLGKNGFAYYDLDTANCSVPGKPGAGNKGGIYGNDGVDIFEEETKNDLYVGKFEDGEWLQYTLNVKESITYKLEISLAAKKEGKILLTLYRKEKEFLAESEVPATGNETTWKTITINNIKLEKGFQTIRIYALKGGFNLKELKFVIQGNYLKKIRTY